MGAMSELAYELEQLGLLERVGMRRVKDELHPYVVACRGSVWGVRNKTLEKGIFIPCANREHAIKYARELANDYRINGGY